MNSRHYAQAIVQRASSSCATSLSAIALLFSTLQRNTSLVFSKALESCSSLQDAYFEAIQEEIKNTCSSGWYSSVLHILGLSTAVGTTINLIYSMYNEGIRPFVHTIINPMDVESGTDASINIMWSTTSKKNTISAWFEPNHFVALLPSAAEPSKTISALHVSGLKADPKPVQFKIQDFFSSSIASRRPANTTGHSVERTKRRSTLTVEVLPQSENSQK